MNAYQLMSFLLIFNVSVSIVLALGIYSSTPAQPTPFSVEEGKYREDVYLSAEALAEKNKAELLGIFGGNIVTALVVGAVLGGALSWLTQIPGDAAFVYAMFIAFYWSMAKNTIDILFTLAGGTGAPGQGMVYVVIVFAIILGISFLSFMMQLVRGPWQSMR